MNLTPLDVRKATFRKVIRGWDPVEAAAFLEVVAENYEQVLQDNAKLTERVQGLEERIRQYQGMERLLQDSMLTAERLAAESRDTTRRESEKHIQEARKRAERILEDSRERLRNLNREIAELAQRKDLYVQRFRSLIQSQILFLEEHHQDLNEIDELGQDVVDLLAQDAGNREYGTELEAGSEDRAEEPEEDFEESPPEVQQSLPEDSGESFDSRESYDSRETFGEESRELESPAEPEPTHEVEAGATDERKDGKQVEVSQRGFFPPRVRREGFFDLKADGETESTS
jgi:cell division initiation protein